MPPLSLTQLYEQYVELGAQLQRGQITHEQFVARAHQLQAQDPAGQWWTIDPQTGRYLTYTANGWVEGTPAAQPVVAPSIPAYASPIRPTPATSQREAVPAQPKRSGLSGCLSSPLITIAISLGAAGLWYAYSSLSPSSEGNDTRTPLIIALTPILLQLLRRPLDWLLGPLYRILNLLPRPLLIGAAFAVPLVVGGIFTDAGGYGYTGLQRSVVTSVVLSYVLSRRPGGSV